MQQCPPFTLTFANNDIFSTELRDNNGYVHYMTRTQAPPRKTFSPRSSTASVSSPPSSSRPSLQRQHTPTRNPTIIVRPKSTSSEAKIVASLQWHHWSDSIFSTRWQVLKLDKVLPLPSFNDKDDYEYNDDERSAEMWVTVFQFENILQHPRESGGTWGMIERHRLMICH